jgi:phosphoglycolate phosphatase
METGILADFSLAPQRRTLFCDFDGPIADVSDRYYATYRLGLDQLQTRSAETLAIRHLSKAQFWTFKQNRVPDRQIAHWSGLETHQIDQFLNLVGQWVNHDSLLGLDLPQPGVRQALDQLRRNSVRIVIVTLRCPEQVHQFLHHHHLAWAVDQVFGPSDINAAYANRANHKIELLQQAIIQQQYLGFSTVQSLMVGDTEADIMAGQTHGLDTIALTCGIRSRRYLKTFRPSRLLPDLKAAAQYLTQQATVMAV